MTCVDVNARVSAVVVAGILLAPFVSWWSKVNFLCAVVRIARFHGRSIVRACYLDPENRSPKRFENERWWGSNLNI
jgi:hypothetical protein